MPDLEWQPAEARELRAVIRRLNDVVRCIPRLSVSEVISSYRRIECEGIESTNSLKLHAAIRSLVQGRIFVDRYCLTNDTIAAERDYHELDLLGFYDFSQFISATMIRVQYLCEQGDCVSARLGIARMRDEARRENSNHEDRNVELFEDLDQIEQQYGLDSSRM